MTEFITINDVGPRDGLQNEQQPVATADKVRLIRLLVDAGLQEIEATAFVSPRWVPQMADAADVLAALSITARRDAGLSPPVLSASGLLEHSPQVAQSAIGQEESPPVLPPDGYLSTSPQAARSAIGQEESPQAAQRAIGQQESPQAAQRATGRENFPRYTVLAPNLKGYIRAKAAGADRVAVFIAASETFSQKNTACSIDESLARVAAIMDAARVDAMPVRGYISCITHCPYEGATDPTVTERLAAALLEMGVVEVSLGETLGRARPEETERLLQAVCRTTDAARLAGHFHDTQGRALESVTVALAHGIRIFDSAAGGLGGCPYAPGAAGNVATGALVDHLTQAGYAHGINREKLRLAETFAQRLRG